MMFAIFYHQVTGFYTYLGFHRKRHLGWSMTHPDALFSFLHRQGLSSFETLTELLEIVEARYKKPPQSFALSLRSAAGITKSANPPWLMPFLTVSSMIPTPFSSKARSPCENAKALRSRLPSPRLLRVNLLLKHFQGNCTVPAGQGVQL